MQSNHASEGLEGPGPSDQKHVSQGRGLWLISIALGFIALWGAVLSEDALPKVVGRNGNERVFSGGRAMDVLTNLLGEEGAHPVGSAAGARIRQRIVDSLLALGAEVKVQDTWVQSSENHSKLARIHNVVGHFPGNGQGKDALLMAHYDSVGAGPGAADDLAGVAAWIEALRAFRVRMNGKHKSGLWVLFTEGEEEGLLGAQAFAEQHPAVDRIGLVVNLEARGATGVSRLFETSPGNAPWVEMYAQHAPQPSASSLSVEVYRRMPNGTDMQIFLDHGLAALNFAFIGDWAVYHSPLDRPERLDVRTLQHHGENALAVLNGIESDDALLRGEQVVQGEDSVHVDLLGGTLLRYSQGTQWACVVLSLLLWLFWWLRLAGRGLTPRNALAAFGIAALVVILPLALVYGALGWAKQLAGTTMVFWSRPMPAVGLAVGSYFVAIAVVLRLARTCPPVALRFASATLALVWSMVLVWFVPGAGFLWVPATLFLMVSLCVLQGPWVRRMPKGWGMGWGAFAGAIVICMLVWIPVHHGLLDAFGFQNAAGLLVPVAVPSTLLLPFMWRSRPSVGGAAVVVGLLCLGFGWAVSAKKEPFTKEKPGTFNVTYTYLVDQNVARLETDTKGFGWPKGVPVVEDGAVAVTPALQQILPAPSMTWIGEDAEGWQRFHIESHRGADRLALEMGTTGPSSIRLHGRVFEQEGSRVQFLGVPPEGLDVEWKWSNPEHVETVRLIDQTLGLPQPIQAWADLAGSSWAPRHRGHRTLVSDVVSLGRGAGSPPSESGD